MRTMKKKLAVFLVLALTLALLGPGVRAAAPEDVSPILKVTEGGAARGGTGTVVIRLERSHAVCGTTFDVRYDPAQLTLQEAKGVTGSALVQINKNIAPGLIRITVASTQPLPEALDLVQLTFLASSQAPLTGCPVTLELRKMYDEAIQPVKPVVESGTFRIHHALLRVNSVEAAVGQAVHMQVYLEGELHPAGGSFVLTYPTEFLRAGSTFAGPILQSSHFSTSEMQPGTIKVSWAGGEALTEIGLLCTLTFEVLEGAQGTYPVEISSVKLVDEQAEALNYQVQNGQITLVAPNPDSPKLWIVGGELQSNGEAMIGVVLEGRGQVNGGSFTLHYDPEGCTLLGVQPKVPGSSVNSALSGQSALPAGTVKFSWADAATSLDAETLLLLRFRVEQVGAPLTLKNVSALDEQLQQISSVEIRNGAICPTGVKLQVPQIARQEIRRANGATQVDLVLDIAQTDLEPVQKNQPIRVLTAFYDNGRMQMAETLADASQLQFDENGFATLNLQTDCQGTPEQMKVFLLDTQSSAPLSKETLLSTK